MAKLLEVQDLYVNLHGNNQVVHAVRGVSFHIDKGETVGLVGESGCGKSITAQTILRLIPSPPSKIIRGTILFNDIDLVHRSDREMEKIRGNHISMIFQDPMTSLNPTMKIGNQIMEGLIRHQHLTKKEARSRTLEMLSLVGISHPEQRIDQYPFEFSGGMRQRVMIAMALVCRPELLIADEPTTALDVTIQAQILALLKKVKQEQGSSILLITHDLGIVAGMCDRVLVMYAGQIVESGTVDQIFYHPQHPYTQALLKAIPKIGTDRRTPLMPIIGSPPDLAHPPTGCPFHPRCNFAMKVCETHRPPYFESEKNHKAACWLHHEFAKGASHHE